MKDYPDPHDYFEQHMREIAEQDSENLSRAGLEPTPTLTRALAERAIQHIGEQYQRDILKIRDHNINLVLQRYRRRMAALDWSGHRLLLRICPLAILFLLYLAWFSFTHPGGFVVGIFSLCGGAIFLSLLIRAVRFDGQRTRQDTPHDRDEPRDKKRGSSPQKADKEVHESLQDE